MQGDHRSRTVREATIIASIVAAAVVLASSPGPSAAGADDDPARINGTWSYRTRSNCGRVDGVGQVAFQWDPARGLYTDNGHVYWADSGQTIRWWGTARFDPAARTLQANVSNSLGDQVQSSWSIIGNGPDRLVTRWSQTNGCHGEGVATRPLR